MVGDDLGDPEAPEVWVLQRAGVGHRALEGSGQAQPCISLNVVTTSKQSGAVAPKPSRRRIAHNRRSRKSSKEIREAVSDRGRAVRSKGEGRPRGAPKGQNPARKEPRS